MPQLPPDQTAKPGGGRGIKKKKVVKKGSTDLAAEREMRGLRVPKKRRALPGKEQRKTEITTPKASKRVVRITEGVTVGDLGRSMGVKAGDLIKKLMELGQMATLNQVLDVDTATLLAGEFGYSVENVSFDAEQAIEEAPEETVVGESVTRPPVVTVMGHVDHGKTSLLDAIRHTNVTAREFGGITQHIGAYTVEANGRTIAFVDTPGHEAFTAMRARGAKVTDIVVLVVAANEGVMPQTQEAINHARAANVPIIVAINKIDLPDANLDNVKQRLTEVGLVPEDYGGDTITVPVSARTGEGIEKLLEMILLQADVMELKANPIRAARGTVVESQLDRGRGPVATVLIQEGTLHQGDPFVCGTSYGRVRAMHDHLGQRLTEAGPSTPVEIFGLSSVPEPGTVFTAVVEESKARQVAEYRRSKQREGELAKTSRVSLEDLSQRMAAGEVKELKVILKGDVQGSVEALADALAPAVHRRGQARGDSHVGRRDFGNRRYARVGFQSHHHRLQHPSRAEGRAASPRKKASRFASTRSSTKRSTTCARRWKVCSRRPTARRRSAAPRSARSSTCPAPPSRDAWWSTARLCAVRARGWCATAARCGKASSPRSSASRTTRAKSRRATNAVSRSKTSTT